MGGDGPGGAAEGVGHAREGDCPGGAAPGRMNSHPLDELGDDAPHAEEGDGAGEATSLEARLRNEEQARQEAIRRSQLEAREEKKRRAARKAGGSARANDSYDPETPKWLLLRTIPNALGPVACKVALGSHYAGQKVS